MTCCILFSILFPGDRIQQIDPTVSQRRDVTARHFILGRDDDIYLYSAIADSPRTLGMSGYLDIVVTALDRSRVSLTCCVLQDGDNVTVYVTPASAHFRSYMTRSTLGERVSEYFIPSLYLARQYRCTVSSSRAATPRYVTLTSSSTCSSNINDYVPIIYPKIAGPESLALCAKIAFSPGLNKQKLVEWFEMQRELGVDRILIFSLAVDESINRIFRYYQDMGLLEVHPYELPGEPKRRSLNEAFKRTRQFVQDETMSLLDCKQRMAGYDFVLSHDLDEMVIPRENLSLKPFFKESLSRYPEAAGFYFYTSFFITDWTASNPKQKLIVKSYRKSREPRWESYKFVFIPDRVMSILTHEIFPKQGYTTCSENRDRGNTVVSGGQPVTPSSCIVVSLLHRPVAQPSETNWHRPSETYRHRPSETYRHRPSETYRHRPSETYRHRPSETYRHRPSETYRHRPSETYRHRPSETYRHRPSETYRHRPSETYRHRPSETYRHRPSETYRHRPSETYRHRPSETYRHRPSETYRHRPSETYRHRPSETYRHRPSETYRHRPSETYRHRPSETYRHRPSETYRHRPSENYRDLM
ncbi:hypothetical protein Btru_021458 [Bulinus truncatus]|nr:hypothetical protein Btru_021458 [Bulinus truncatus]